jgi:superfamily I DNA/RNA helicase
LCDLEHDVIKQCVEKTKAVVSILDGDDDIAERAAALEALGFGSAVELQADLELRPIRGSSDPGAEEAAEGREIVGAAELETIMGAKGLSADHVIVIGCDDVNLGHVSRSAFFVALTRARKSLTLLACVGGGGATFLHEFVCALPEEDTEALQVKSGGSTTSFASIDALQEQLGKMAYARKMAAVKKRR